MQWLERSLTRAIYENTDVALRRLLAFVFALDGAGCGNPPFWESSPAEVTSWQRVLARYHDVAVESSPTYLFLQGKIDDLFKRNAAFFSAPNWPETLATQYKEQPDALRDASPNFNSAQGPVASSTKSPSASSSPIQISTATSKPQLMHLVGNTRIFCRNPALTGSGVLTIQNGTGHYAIIKLINAQTLAKEFVFGVDAGQTQPFINVPDGTYLIIFSVGDNVSVEHSQSFVPCLACSRFEQPVVFTTQRENTSLVYSKNLITLNPVPGGNAKTQAITEQEYDKWWFGNDFESANRSRGNLKDRFPLSCNAVRRREYHLLALEPGLRCTTCGSGLHRPKLEELLWPSTVLSSVRGGSLRAPAVA